MDERGLRQSGIGMTRDISAAGVFIRARTPPPMGLPLQFEIEMPALRIGIPPIRLVAQGCVIRVEAAGKEESGFAALTEEFVLEVIRDKSG